MSITDILGEGLFESVKDISAVSMLVTLLLSFVIGLFIFQVYKRTYQNVVYTKSFNISLIGMTMVTSLVIMAVTANVVLSLGMVGALSIVRFRTAIKDPMDIVFMFWALAVGIVLGAGFYLLGVIGSLVIGLILYLLNKNIQNDVPYVMLVSFSNEADEEVVMNIVKRNVKKYFLKSKTVDGDAVELVVELRLDGETMAFVNDVKHIESVQRALLVNSSEFSS